MGGNLAATVHHQALPTVSEVQSLPGLQNLIPPQKASHRVSVTKKSNGVKKKPAAAKHVVSVVVTKRATCQMKKPAASASGGSSVVAKKPAKNAAQ